MKLQKIENPTLKDLEPIIDLLNEVFSAFPDSDFYTPQKMTEKLKDKKTPVVFVMKDKKKLVAFAICSERYENYLHLWQLGVSKDYSKQGLATELYSEIELFADEEGYKGVTLNTFNKFRESLRLAISRGYEIYGLQTDGEFENDPKINLKLLFFKK